MPVRELIMDNTDRAGIVALLGSLSVDLKDPEGVNMAIKYLENIDSHHSALPSLRNALSKFGNNLQ